MTEHTTTIFEQIVLRELPATIYLETEHTIVIQDKYPNAPYHELVIPKKFYQDLGDFLEHASEQEQGDFYKTLTQRILHHSQEKRDFKILSNNGKKAGQEIMHLHYHVMAW